MLPDGVKEHMTTIFPILSSVQISLLFDQQPSVWTLRLYVSETKLSWANMGHSAAFSVCGNFEIVPVGLVRVIVGEGSAGWN